MTVAPLVQKTHREEWERFLRTRSIEDRNRLVELNQELARANAIGVWKRIPHTAVNEFEDLHGDASIGLMKAVERFNPARGVQFETFAPLHIRGAIVDGMRERDHLSRLDRQRIKQGAAANVSVVSIEDLSFRNSDGKVQAFQVEEQVDAVVDDDWWRVACRGLSETDTKIIEAYYRRNISMKRIGEEVGFSESRISQMHSALIPRVRRNLERKDEPRRITANWMPADRRYDPSLFGPSNEPPRAIRNELSRKRMPVIDELLLDLEAADPDEVRREIAAAETRIAKLQRLLAAITGESLPESTAEPPAKRKPMRNSVIGEYSDEEKAAFAQRLEAALANGPLKVRDILKTARFSPLQFNMAKKGANLTLNRDGSWQLANTSVAQPDDEADDGGNAHVVESPPQADPRPASAVGYKERARRVQQWVLFNGPATASRICSELGIPKGSLTMVMNQAGLVRNETTQLYELPQVIKDAM